MRKTGILTWYYSFQNERYPEHTFDDIIGKCGECGIYPAYRADIVGSLFLVWYAVTAHTV